MAKKGPRSINRKLVEQFNKEQLELEIGTASLISKKSAAATRTKGDRTTLMSKMTLGKQSIVSKRSKPVQLNSLFEADAMSVKTKNTETRGEAEGEPERFGRWMLRQAAANVFDNRSRSVLATIEEQEKPVLVRQSVD